MIAMIVGLSMLATGTGQQAHISSGILLSTILFCERVNDQHIQRVDTLRPFLLRDSHFDCPVTIHSPGASTHFRSRIKIIGSVHLLLCLHFVDVGNTQVRLLYL
jgi:hypothetical protein